jgi:hypothetical protein
MLGRSRGVVGHLVFRRKLGIRELVEKSVNENPGLFQTRGERGKGAFSISVEDPLRLVGGNPGVREHLREIRLGNLPWPLEKNGYGLPGFRVCVGLLKDDEIIPPQVLGHVIAGNPAAFVMVAPRANLAALAVRLDFKKLAHRNILLIFE